MLTAEQIAALRDYAGKLTDPINDYLIRDIAERIAKAGQFTSTAQYQIWAAQQMGLSQVEIKKRLKKLLGVSNDEIKKLLTQSAEVGYRFDLKALPTADAIPFSENHVLQEIVSAAVKLAQDDFTNITQTIGMVDPYGRALPLQQAYRNSMDFAFSQVATGASDYNTAVRLAVKNLAEKGIQTIDYQSGIHTSLEAAVRRSVMGGLGLMQEQISNQTHDDIGANGWEISAHAASAPDHEPIQGKQYSDEEYEKLNNSLVRRIGTLNCGHAAFPIILGVTPPQYTKEELEKYRLDNERGIEYAGKHYTLYEATQRQRRLEASMRRQKRRILADEATGDQEKKQQDQIKLQVLNQEYRRFTAVFGTGSSRIYCGESNICDIYREYRSKSFGWRSRICSIRSSVITTLSVLICFDTTLYFSVSIRPISCTIASSPLLFSKSIVADFDETSTVFAIFSNPCFAEKTATSARASCVRSPAALENRRYS